MIDELISFEVAKLAKEKGFPQLKQGIYYTKNKEHCLVGWGFRDETKESFAQFSAATQSLLQRWLREKHNIHIEIEPLVSGRYLFYLKEFKDKVDLFLEYENYNNKYLSYEEALEKGLQEGLKLII